MNNDLTYRGQESNYLSPAISSMIKSFYLKELTIPATQSRDATNNDKKAVGKIQSWLMLHEFANPGVGTATSIDGDFGPSTEQAVKNYQNAMHISPSGKMSPALFAELSSPMKKAFTSKLKTSGLRNRIVEAAALHLKQHPMELVIKQQNNCGPWVRAYMDGQEGESWYWCMGFVQAIIDQAASSLNKNWKSMMPLTYSCDDVGNAGLSGGNLFRFTKIRSDHTLMKPGDIFLIQKTPTDWIHTGIIVKVTAETIETIEGNTDASGSRNGVGVFRRVRNFMQSKIDVFSMEALV